MWKQILIWGLVVAFGLLWMSRRSQNKRTKKTGN
jgi:hypothetical protein